MIGKSYTGLKKSCLRLKRTLAMQRKTIPIDNSCFYSRVNEVLPYWKSQSEKLVSPNKHYNNTKGYSRVYKIKKKPYNHTKVKDVENEY